MATYVNNLRLKEIATGAESGTWGTSTNTNLELIGDGLGYGTEQVAADSNETFTMADGVADGMRAMYLKFTSAGSLTATRELTLAPNTVSKVWIIENATTGGQIITIKQGSGATVNVANGARAFVYTDGAGAGAAVSTADPSLVGLQNLTAGADIASATTLDLTAATGNTVVITGTTTTTAFTMNAGQQMILIAAAAWPLTFHATTCNVNGGVSYTCAAGDRLYVTKTLAGVIKVSVFKQDGTSVVAAASDATQVLSDGATVNWDVSAGNIGLWAIGGNRALAAPTNLVVGSSALRITQDATGSRTVTWNAIFKWSGGAAPVLSTAGNAVDIVSFIYDGTYLYGSLVSRGAS